MRTFTAALLAVSALAAGCAAKKQIVLPMRQAPRVAVPGAIRTLMFTRVSDRAEAPPAGFRGDGGDGAALAEAMLVAEFSASSYAVLNDEVLQMVKKSNAVPKYLSNGPTIAADFINQMIGDPGSIGVVEVEVSSSFGQRLTAEQREITLTTTTYNAGVPRADARRVRVPVHRIDVHGAVSARIVIRSPYPDGREVFSRDYTVPAFSYSSVEAAPRDLFFFGRNDAAKQGNAAPTLTEVKALQYKKLARMFFEDISSSVQEQPATLDDRGDRMAYNLLAEGAFPWAERRLRKLGREGSPAQQAANLYNLGLCWEAQGLASEAAVKYKAALELEPGNSLFRKAHDRANAQSR